MNSLKHYLELLNNNFIVLRNIVFSVTGQSYYTLETEFNEEVSKKISSLITQYNQGIPLEYLLTSAEFLQLQFYVDSSVLIPRPDSEYIVLEAWKNTRATTVLDLGSGSGCLSIAYATQNANLQKITFLDISDKALSVAKKNFTSLITNSNCEAEFIHSSWYNFDFKKRKYDIIFFNPPYIDRDNDEYQSSILHEPHDALFAEQKGMEHYIFVLSNISNLMDEESEAYIEISYNKLKEIKKLCDDYNLYIEAKIYDGHHIRALKLKKRLINIPIKVISFIESFERDIRLVGGSVRDLLLNKEISDYDFCTPLEPEDIIRIATRKKWKFLLHGVEHGTVSILYYRHVYEVTSLRKDTLCDGRHAKVQYGASYIEDASRRDFTINAMSYDVRFNQIYDYFNGREDLRNKNVQFVGDAEKRVDEDYLRILRYFRFLLRYGQNVQYEDLILDKAIFLKTLSLERIIMEFDKIFMHRDVERLRYVIDRMNKLNIFSSVLGIERINSKAILGEGESLVYATLFFTEINLFEKMARSKVREIIILQRFFYDRDFAEILILYMDHKLPVTTIKLLQKIHDFDLPTKDDFITGVMMMNMGYHGREIAIERKKRVQQNLVPKLIRK